MLIQPAHVVVGFHSFGLVTSKFCYALCRALAYEGGRIKSVIEFQSPYTDDARNKIVESFLAMPFCDYLLMVDADMEFEKDAISKTMWVARHREAEVVWGNYSLGNFNNSIFSKDPKSDMAVAEQSLEPNKIYENGVYGGGTGWCLMSRKLLEDMREKYAAPWHWFDRETLIDERGKPVKFGEDLTFGKRVYEMGRKQVGYTGINLIHHKMHATVPVFMSGEQKGDVHKMVPQTL